MVSWLIKLTVSQAKLAGKGIVIRVCGLANSKGLLLDSEGLPLDNWRDRMAQRLKNFH